MAAWRTQAGVVLFLSPVAASQPSFTALGLFPGANASIAAAISGDGRVVVGRAVVSGDDRAFRWTVSGGMFDLGLLPGGGPNTAATAVSWDGSVIVGLAANSPADHGWVWTASGGMQDLGAGIKPQALSGDGSVVVGYSLPAGGGTVTAFRWTAGGGIQLLPGMPGSNRTEATGISADGLLTVGWSRTASATSPVVWNERNEMEILGLPAGATGARALAISPDGTVIVGWVFYATINAPSVWRRAQGWTVIWAAANANMEVGASEGGGVIVGHTGTNTAFIVTHATGPRDPIELLQAMGVGFGGWSQRGFPCSVSADGLAFVGTGIQGSFERAWIARLPHGFGCYPNCDGNTVAPVLTAADFQCFVTAFTAGDPWANCDGSTRPPVLNVGDFVCFSQRFAAGCP